MPESKMNMTQQQISNIDRQISDEYQKFMDRTAHLRAMREYINRAMGDIQNYRNPAVVFLSEGHHAMPDAPRDAEMPDAGAGQSQSSSGIEHAKAMAALPIGSLVRITRLPPNSEAERFVEVGTEGIILEFSGGLFRIKTRGGLQLWLNSDHIDTLPAEAGADSHD